MRLALPITCIAAIALHVTGCSAPPDISDDLAHTHQRAAVLVSLAAEEAGAITDIDQRLTRQLNIADLQLRRFTDREALKTLAAARATLTKHGDKLNDHARISGWVSVSELTRRANDPEGAKTACTQAVMILKAIDDEATRCEYVMGVANEVHHLQGDDAAAELLAEAGPWARAIDPRDERRKALLAFSIALFNLDHFEKGIAVLRNEPEPAWRSDVLVKLSQTPTPSRRHGPTSFIGRSTAPMKSQAARAQSSEAAQYGKDVSYQRVFQGKQQSDTKR